MSCVTTSITCVSQKALVAEHMKPNEKEWQRDYLKYFLALKMWTLQKQNAVLDDNMLYPRICSGPLWHLLSFNPSYTYVTLITFCPPSSCIHNLSVFTKLYCDYSFPTTSLLLPWECGPTFFHLLSSESRVYFVYIRQLIKFCGRNNKIHFDKSWIY